MAMRYEPTEAIKDETNIEFQPQGQATINKFGRYINGDLQLLGLSCLGTLTERRNRLMTALKACETFKESRKGHEAAKYPGAMIMV